MPALHDGQAAAVRADLIDADFNYRRRYDPQRISQPARRHPARGLIQRVVLRPLDGSVIAEGRFFGRHVGMFGGLPPTGLAVDFPFSVVVNFREGLMAGAQALARKPWQVSGERFGAPERSRRR